jgi:hypothetical protein
MIMKLKIQIFFLFLLVSCLQLNGQGYFSTTIDSTNRTYSGFEANQEFLFKLNNSTSLIKDYSWTRKDLCPMPSGWEAFICDCDVCWPTSIYNCPTPGTVITNCSFLMTYQFAFMADMGTHRTQLDIYNPLDSLNSTTRAIFTINHGCTPSNLSAYSNLAFIVYPLPCADQLHVSLANEYENLDLTLFDLFGKIIMNQKVGSTQSEIILSMNQIQSGLYYLVLKDNITGRQSVQKIQKQ